MAQPTPATPANPGRVPTPPSGFAPAPDTASQGFRAPDSPAPGPRPAADAPPPPDQDTPDQETTGQDTPGQDTPGKSTGSARTGSRFRPAPRIRVTAEAPRGNDRWSEVPLSARIVMTVTALLVMGLTVGGAATITLLRVNLVQQVDDDLYALAQELDDVPLTILEGNAPATLPSNYFVRITPYADPSEALTLSDARFSGDAGVPHLLDPPMPDQLVDGERISTVPGSLGSWRALTMPWSNADTGRVLGVVTVALPLERTESTIERTTTVLLATGVTVTVAGVAIALVMVHRALRPLRRIESTAGAIAQGDLSRRVPDLPVTTEVGSLARSLNVMLSQIENAFSEREASEMRMRRFVSDASHELRTPLSTIRGYAELFRMGAVPTAQTADVMHRIEGESNRMGSLVEDLLQLARLDEGRTLALTPVDLVDVAEDAAADMRALDAERVARVVGTDGTPGVELPVPESLLVTADDDRVRQVVANLVGNVLQHTGPGVPLELAVGTTPEAPGMALLEVRDHGPGIPPDEQRAVFERFHRVDSSRNRASGGSGLGLAIVAAIIDAHRGVVRATQTPGGGVTMQILLPLTTPDEEESASRD